MENREPALELPVKVGAVQRYGQKREFCRETKQGGTAGISRSLTGEGSTFFYTPAAKAGCVSYMHTPMQRKFKNVN